MALWLLNCTDKECEVEFVEEMKGPSIWLNISSGRLLAVTASELIQCISYPELEMEAVFRIPMEKGWYAISKGSLLALFLSFSYDSW